jgi:hypothetical protein
LRRLSKIVLVLVIGLSLPASIHRHARTRAVINPDNVLVIDGKKVFPIGFTMPPPPNATAPNGKNAISELKDAGATFLRTGVMGGPWNDAAIEMEQQYLDVAARNGMYCWPALRELGDIEPGAVVKEAMLRKVVNRFKDHPGLGAWKTVDEPEWGKQAVGPMMRASEIIRELDPNHPIVVIQAPRGTVETLKPYNVTSDIVGADIYPVGYPPGAHSLLPNKEISMVGDYTRKMMGVSEGKKPVWMVLQIAWSGVIKPGKTLRFPTFAEERFMVYQAIINGARGLIFFGGHIPKAMTPEDAQRGWNWRFWNRVLRPVIEEIGEGSPIYPALVGPDSKVPVRVSKGQGIEFCIREVGQDLFLLACKRSGPAEQVEFSGLPGAAGEADVSYEPPRTVQASTGKFTDWFAPFEVHVYRFRLE